MQAVSHSWDYVLLTAPSPQLCATRSFSVNPVSKRKSEIPRQTVVYKTVYRSGCHIIRCYQTSQYKPYRKPGDTPLYLNALSSHPPVAIQNLLTGIRRRLSNIILSSHDVFQETVPVYRSALSNSGYSEMLEYTEKAKRERNMKRRRTIIIMV